VVLEEFRRGAVRLHILHHACEREIHGAWMRDELAEHGHRISPGTLYPVLHGMEADGLLTSHEEVVAGRVRRLYQATDQGRQELAACRRALAELAGEVLTDRPECS
jgi:DNA-binding PadR family transcriptional regulator